MSTWNLVYERTKGGWSASVPVPGTPKRVDGETREKTEENIREDKDVKPHLIAKEGQPSPEFQHVDRPYRLQFFTNKIDWLGPGIVLLSALYFSVQVWVAWVFTPRTTSLITRSVTWALPNATKMVTTFAHRDGFGWTSQSASSAWR